MPVEGDIHKAVRDFLKEHWPKTATHLFDDDVEWALYYVIDNAYERGFEEGRRDASIRLGLQLEGVVDDY